MDWTINRKLNYWSGGYIQTKTKILFPVAVRLTMTTPNEPSSKGRKRKHGMVAASREAPISELKERVQKMQRSQHKARTVSGNHDHAAKLIKWLVDENMTDGLTTSTDSEFKIKVGTRYYWFDWGRLRDIAEGLMCFCETQGRKNVDGKLIPESHSTLGKYRSALSHFRKKAFLKGIVIPDADISIYDAKVTAYFTGVERYEQKLKQDGIIPAQKGGTDFPVELFRENCKLAYKKYYILFT